MYPPMVPPYGASRRRGKYPQYYAPPVGYPGGVVPMAAYPAMYPQAVAQPQMFCEYHSTLTSGFHLKRRVRSLYHTTYAANIWAAYPLTRAGWDATRFRSSKRRATWLHPTEQCTIRIISTSCPNARTTSPAGKCSSKCTRITWSYADVYTKCRRPSSWAHAWWGRTADHANAGTRSACFRSSYGTLV